MQLKINSCIFFKADPNDARTHIQPVKPIVTAPPTDGELTEEELKFMTEEIGEEDASDQDLDGLDGGMTEDIADAYEQFLAEQSRNGNGGS